jgi:hypothetical protein
MNGVPLRLAAQIHNDLQDLTFALEYTEQGARTHVPERIQEYIGKLLLNAQALHDILKGETHEIHR